MTSQVFSLELSKIWVRFSSPATAPIVSHSDKTNGENMLTVWPKLSTNNTLKPGCNLAAGRKCETASFQGTSLGRTKWKASFVGGENTTQTLGLETAAPRSCQILSKMLSQKRKRANYKQKGIVYILAVWLSIYCTCNTFSHLGLNIYQKPPTYSQAPDRTRRRNKNSWDSLFLQVIIKPYAAKWGRGFVWENLSRRMREWGRNNPTLTF